MPNRLRVQILSLIALSLSAGTTFAQQDDALETLYAQQATQVRTLVEQLKSSDSNRQQFALWQLELELAIPAGATTQPMLEEAAAAGVLSVLEQLSSASDAEVAASAAGLHAKLTEALGLAARPAQPRSILDGVAAQSFDSRGEASWLALNIEAGKEYRVRAAGCDLISALVVRSDDLAVIEGGFAVKRSFNFTSERDDSVLMRVSPASCSSAAMVNVSSGAPMRSITGSFSLPEAVFVSDGRYMGRLAENDQQWMYLSLPAGRSVEIVASPEENDLDTYLTIYDVSGRTTLAEDDDGGSGLGSRLVYTSASDGEVLIKVSRLGSNWGEYELAIAEMVPPGERGNVVELGVLYAGDLRLDSREWWRFEPEAGVRYRINVDPYDSLDSYIKIYESDGSTLIDEDDDGGDGLGSRIDFTRASNSPVLIEVHSLNDEAGTYRLTMSESALRFGHEEHAVGVGNYRGYLSDGDESFWRLDTPAGRYRVEVLPSGSLDSVITLYDADAADEIDSDDDGGQGFGSLLQFVSPSDTTHVLGVSSLSGAGNFELMLSALPHPAQMADTAEPGGIYRAGIRYGEERWWRIDTESGTTYDIEALPRDDLDTIMELYAADGATQLDSDDDGGQGFGSRIRHMSVSGEPVLIRVTGLSGSTGEFELIVR